MDNPLVSVIIPVFNAEAWIRRCLDSVLGQSYERLEVIAVSDGSTDGSESILRDYESRDSRFIFLCQENLGVSAARNHGLAKARGDWICFVDADDYVHVDYVKSMLREALDHDADAVSINFYLELPRGWRLPYPFIILRKQLTGKEAVKQCFRMLHFPTFVWNKLFRRSLFTDQALSFPPIIYEDAYLVPLLLLGCRKVIALKKPRYHYIRQPVSLTHRIGFEHVSQYLTAANMLRHHFWRSDSWEEWSKPFSHYLGRILIQITLTLFLTRRTLSFPERRILISQARANIKALRSPPEAGDSPQDLPHYVGPAGPTG